MKTFVEKLVPNIGGCLNGKKKTGVTRGYHEGFELEGFKAPCLVHLLILLLYRNSYLLKRMRDRQGRESL